MISNAQCPQPVARKRTISFRNRFWITTTSEGLKRARACQRAQLKFKQDRTGALLRMALSQTSVYRGALVLHCDHFAVLNEHVAELSKEVPVSWKQHVEERDGSKSKHITVVGPNEWKTVKQAACVGVTVAEDDLSPIGLGTTADCSYVCILSSLLTSIRLSLGLQPKDLHITVGFANRDSHDVRKGLETIAVWHDNPKSLAANLARDVENIRQGHCTPQQRRMLLELFENCALAVSRVHAERSPEASAQCLLLAAKSALVRDAPPSVTKTILSELAEIDPVEAAHLHFKHAVSRGTMADPSGEVHAKLKALVSEHKTLDFDSRLQFLANQARDAALLEECVWGKDGPAGALKLHKLPRNAAPVLAGCGTHLWGSGLPSANSVAAVVALGITKVVTLTEEPLDEALRGFATEINPDIVFHHCPIDDRHAPATLEELIVICRDVQRGRMVASAGGGGVLVHCLGGKGRTALVLAGTLMLEEPSLSASAALSRVRCNRSVLVTEEQTRMLKQLFAALAAGPWRALAAPGTTASHAKSMPRLPAAVPRVVVLCGLPGAGKSTFAQALAARFPHAVRHINQDELGARNTQEAWAASVPVAMRGEQQVVAVLDKCLCTAAERREALQLVSCVDGQTADLVYFSLPAVKCSARATARTDHVGDVSGHRAARVVEALAKKLEPPALVSGTEGFGRVHEISSDEDARELLELWCGPAHKGEAAIGHGGAAATCSVVSFPRTRHLMDLGAATRDDLLVGDGAQWLKAQPLHTTVSVEEKIDGANMGFRLAEDGVTILTQNRSHFVNPVDHPQFRKLGKWLSDHHVALRRVLRDQNMILYGEWVYATHSVEYDALPGYFIAFDLRCLLTNTFVAREELARVLQGSGIPVTPLLLERPSSTVTIQEIRALVERQSTFSSSASEGVVVRMSRNGLTTDRAKIVRPNFCAGNEHWNRGPLQENHLSFTARTWGTDQN
ncbi:hypothetical protein CYMTET_41126 [Cymbomonas tetramitiformis]|uniref:Tyrosine specific protein phosphatases domain-containing protein n=1 Tax=Cymbomonas tetramitiformis TaxID=36881 RepID=A0AAE0F2V1_9CHLO|nr:hypothetical protein CYMTET_41126 [Cymbomonas tetramitiformis]